MTSSVGECGLTEKGGQLRGVSVLVVDSYEPLRWLKSHLLRKNGAEVLEAATGIDALAILECAKVDVALIDTSLPGVDPTDLFDRIRAMAAGTPVIFTAASAQESLPATAPILGEPLDTRKLVGTINNLLGRSALSTVD